MRFFYKTFASFRTRLMVLVLLPTIPAFALALQRNLQQRQSEKSRVVQEISAVSRLLAANQRSYVRNTRQLLATLSSLHFLVHSSDSNFCRVNFNNLITLSPDYLNFGLIESNGIIFTSAITTNTAPRSLADRPYFQRTQAYKKFSIGGYQLGRLTRQRTLTFGYPVTNKSGSLFRVLFASLRLDRLTEAGRGIPLPDGAIATVIDTSGNILARLPDEGSWVGKAFPDAELVREMLKVGEGVMQTRGLDNTQRVYAVTSISDDVAPQLFVAVGVPTSVLFASANEMLRRNLFVMAGTIFAALLGAWLFANRALIRPVRSLSETADQLARGNLAARSHATHSTLEIRQLSDSFNLMASSLEQREADLRNAHADIARINAELENRVNERTAQLTAANQELESFSYSVSHDLRAPLRHMDGFAELLKKNQHDRLDEKGRRHLQIISDAARKMGALIDDLLVFSRMGRQEMQRDLVNMNELVKDSIAQYEPDCADRKIEWNISPLPDVQGDCAMLKQVWLNLISNALKYSRTRDVSRIEIGCGVRPAEFIFHVRDNGVGFDMRYADKLFGVFQRLHREDEFEGTGVGLANIRRIIVRHGGRTWAESAPDQGATFYFSIPTHD